MGNIFSKFSLSQVLTFLFGTVLVWVVDAVIKDPATKQSIQAVLANILALLMIVLRKPSTQGGTVIPAATIEPGSTVVEPATAKK